MMIIAEYFLKSLFKSPHSIYLCYNNISYLLQRPLDVFFRVVLQTSYKTRLCISNNYHSYVTHTILKYSYLLVFIIDFILLCYFNGTLFSYSVLYV